jgi:hypothetical protein
MSAARAYQWVFYWLAALDGVQSFERASEKAVRVDTFINRHIRPEFPDRFSQLADRADPVAALDMMQRDRKVNDRLKEELTRRAFVHPCLFKRLVALEELAGVELPDGEWHRFPHASLRVTMLGWLRKRKTPDPAPLRGAPPHPRMKSYSANTGYVYQYYFAGQRDVVRDRVPGNEYVFHISADRKTVAPVTVFVADEIVEAWIRENGRDLRGSHRYAIAKMALRDALDERPPEQALADVSPDAGEVAAILAELDA